jgi:hypothetical protein
MRSTARASYVQENGATGEMKKVRGKLPRTLPRAYEAALRSGEAYFFFFFDFLYMPPPGFSFRAIFLYMPPPGFSFRADCLYMPPPGFSLR